MPRVLQTWPVWTQKTLLQSDSVLGYLSRARMLIMRAFCFSAISELALDIGQSFTVSVAYCVIRLPVDAAPL